MTEKERKSLVGRTARDKSEMEFGDVEIRNIRRNNKGYEVTYNYKWM